MDQLENLLENESFMEQLENMTDYKEVMELFKKHGADIAEKEAKVIVTALTTQEELTEEALSGVFGGMIIPPWLRNLYGKTKTNGGFSGGGRGF